MNPITYTSNNVKTVMNPSNVSNLGNLYDLAKEYKTKLTKFDENITYNEIRTKEKIIPSLNVVKDIFSSSGKFFSKKLLIYDNITLPFKELQNIFEVKLKIENVEYSYFVFDKIRTSALLNLIYSKVGINLKANSDLIGKKINLYFPKDTNNTWFIRKFVTIESSSAPIELVSLAPLAISNEPNTYKAYNVDLGGLSGMVNSTTDMDIIGGKVKISKIGNDTATWLRSSWGKVSEVNNARKKGWGKILIDLPLYNDTLVDVYAQSVDSSVFRDSTVEIAFPIYVNIEDLLTNTSVFNKYGSYVLDSVNFFNVSYITNLRSLHSLEGIKKLTDLLPTDTKENKKNISRYAKAMSIYLSLKRAYIGILRKIRTLFDAFSIKDLNKLLKSISVFNNKKNYIVKKKKVVDSQNNASFLRTTHPVDLTLLSGFVNTKNLGVVTRDIVNNVIEWGKNKTFSLKTSSDIQKAIEDLASFYNDHKYLDPQNSYSVISAQNIVSEVRADVSNQRKILLDAELEKINFLSQTGSSRAFNALKALAGENVVSVYMGNIYSKYYKNFVKLMGEVVYYYMETYLYQVNPNIALPSNFNEEVTKLLVAEFKANYLEPDLYGIMRKLFATLLDQTSPLQIPYVEETAKNVLLVNETIILAPLKKKLNTIMSYNITVNEFRDKLKEATSDFLNVILEFEKWYNNSNKLHSIDVNLFSSINPVELFEAISNLTKIKFSDGVVNDVKDSFKVFSTTMTIDYQILNYFVFGYEVFGMKCKDGLGKIIDLKAAIEKKLSENENQIPVVSDPSIIVLPTILISSNQQVADYDVEMGAQNINNQSQELTGNQIKMEVKSTDSTNYTDTKNAKNKKKTEGLKK